MSHTIIDTTSTRTYVGFSRLLRSELKPGSKVVIAWFDGEPELWMVEDEEGLQALRNYYRDDWGDREIPFTVLS